MGGLHMAHLHKREHRSAALAVALTLAMGGVASAQSTYPQRPIKIVHINAAGGPADILSRIIGDKLTAAWRQPVVVEPMVGAAGNLAVGHVAKAAPDGYTLVMSGDAAITTNVSLYKNLPYDPLKHLAPITQLVSTPNILAVHPDVPAKTVQELVALAKSPSTKLTYAHGGVGFSTHLAGQVFNIAAGSSIQQIPIRNSAALMTDLLTNRVNMCFCNISQMLPLIREGKLRGLAVTSLERVPQVPELPTLHESGFPGFDVTSWFALLAPAGTPAPVIDKLHNEIIQIVGQPELRQRLADMGMQVVANTPAQLTAVIQKQIQDRKILIEAAKIELQ
jgi:tripartite-type tricarboxylate transporter receptor subunit TctC